MRLFLEGENRYAPIEKGKNYNGVDLLKFICALLVFIIHIPPFIVEQSICDKFVNLVLQHCVCRLAVPFFFVSSGFFLFKKMPLYKLDKDIIKIKCFNILRLLGIWYVLAFAGGTGHLWYLGAMVTAIILLSICLHFRIRLGCIYAIAGVLYGIGLLGDSYYGIIAPLESVAIIKLIFETYEFVFFTTRNGVFMGFIFVLMGATFASNKIFIKPRTALIGLVVSLFCLISEFLLLEFHKIPNGHNMYVFLLPATFFLFSFATSMELKDHSIYKHLRRIGTLFYFTHLLFIALTAWAIKTIDKYCGVGLAQYQFILALLLTLSVAILVDWLSHKEKFRWINWIIS